MKKLNLLARSIILCVLLGSAAHADLLINFPYNEGTGTNVTDTASGLVGKFGLQQDPATDTAVLVDTSPSGLPGDRSLKTSGNGFLIADDSAARVLDITNGPITMETWVYIDSTVPAKAIEGILAYGLSYKMGLRGGYQVFTLFGRADITNTVAGVIGTDRWIHLAAAWEPGAGVHFYVDGVENFEVYTNSPARPVQHNWLSLGSEGFANTLSASFDRARIHHALLAAPDLDSVAGTVRAPGPNTIVAYNFDETALPANNSKTPALPAFPSAVVLPSLGRPSWTNDSPSGLPDDYALSFNEEIGLVRDVIYANYGSTAIDLGVNNTNFTLEAWVKLPTRLINERMVIYRTDGDPPRVTLSITANRTLQATILGMQDFVSNVLVPNDGRWHHIAAVMEGNLARMRFYLDGVSKQTINKSATANPGSRGTVNTFITGWESDARFYQGLLDRVRVHNTSVAEANLDSLARPGLALISVQPEAEVLVDVGGTANISTTVISGTPETYQWYYRSNLLSQAGVPVAGATASTLTLANVSLKDQGVYYLRVTNAAGVAESHGSKLLVRSAPGSLQRAWELLPGSRPYLTPYNSTANLRDLERGMAYNPVTKHLLVGARWTSPNVKGIYIVDAATGAHVGELPGVSNIVAGGTIVLTRVVVADDGAIFACNFGSHTAASPLKIYRWANETAEPTVAYTGLPVASQQWGKNMLVRGSGVNTEILLDTRTQVLALFKTTDGENFTPTLIQATAARSDDWNNGLAWGEANTLWGKNNTEPLYQWYLDPATNGITLLRSIADVPRYGFGNFTFSADQKYLAGLVVQPGPDSVDVYDMTNPDLPVLVDTGLFTSDNTQTVGYGNVIIVENRIYALNPNNGIVAFEISQAQTRPALAVAQIGNEIRITWDASATGFILESASDLTSTTWVTVPHTTSGSQNVAVDSATGVSKFYRLKKQ